MHDAVDRFAGQAPVAAALRPVDEVGLGYLRLGEPTPSLSGGEAQRLRIASRLRSSQRGVLYVFDEPSTGLHPLDVGTLVGVFDRLLDAGATVIVIDHDLDLLAAADYLIDIGPGAGRTVAGSSPRAPRARSRGIRAASPRRGWPRSWACRPRQDRPPGGSRHRGAAPRAPAVTTGCDRGGWR